LIQDAVIMFLGLLWLTGSWGMTLNAWVIMYAWALFFYGVGVGGEVCKTPFLLKIKKSLTGEFDSTQ
jgi:hypothetical protein